MAAAVALVRLKARPQFLKVATKGRKVARRTLVLQALEFTLAEQADAKRRARQTHLGDAVFLGFTASKKVGNAVARNRAKRRLTALAAAVVPHAVPKGWAVVLIARAATVAAPFAQLDQDLRAALAQVLPRS